MLDRIKKEILCNAEKCCEENWDKVFYAIQEIILCNRIVFKHGILYFEDFVKEIKDKDFKYFMQLVVDGVEPELIEKCIEDAFYLEKRTDFDNYMFFIYAYGSRHLQYGASLRTLIPMLQSIVPYSFRNRISEDVLNGESFIKKLYKYIIAWGIC